MIYIFIITNIYYYRYQEKYKNIRHDLINLLIEVLNETKFQYHSNYGIISVNLSTLSFIILVLKFFALLDVFTIKDKIIPIVFDYLNAHTF